MTLPRKTGVNKPPPSPRDVPSQRIRETTFSDDDTEPDSSQGKMTQPRKTGVQKPPRSPRYIPSQKTLEIIRRAEAAFSDDEMESEDSPMECEFEDFIKSKYPVCPTLTDSRAQVVRDQLVSDDAALTETNMARLQYRIDALTMRDEIQRKVRQMINAKDNFAWELHAAVTTDRVNVLKKFISELARAPNPMNIDFDITNLL